MENYPVSLNIDYSEHSNRVTVFFRIFIAIPILIIFALLTSESYVSQTAPDHTERVRTIGVIFVPTVLMILFRKKYPKWWFDWNLALMKFSLRVGCYLLFLRDEYPSTDEEQAVHLEIAYPDVKQ